METKKTFCEKNGLDESRVLEVVVGQGGGLLPQKTGFQGYFAEVTDTALVFCNDVLGVKLAVPFTSFRSAEFGIGSGQLWLQCNIGGKSVAFCLRRCHWKSALALEMLDKIASSTGEILDWKAYRKYTGPLFLLHILLN